jgi:hypothetical protein
MLIVWRGLGFLVLFVTLGVVAAGAFLTEKFMGPGQFRQQAWPLAAATAAAATACWFLGRRLNKPARSDANPRRPWTHDFLFVRMEWWAFPLVAAAVVVFLTGWRPGDAPQTLKAAGQQTQKLAPVVK